MINHTHARMALIGWLLAFSIPAAVAQSPGTPVEVQSANVTTKEKQVIAEAVLRLRDKGKIINRDEIGRQLETPQPEPFKLTKRLIKAMQTPEESNG